MHELTKLLKDSYGKVDDIITAYMKEKAEWLKRCLIAPHYNPSLQIDKAFGLNHKTLEEKLREGLIPPAQAMIEFDKIIEIAKQHFREHRNELDQ